MWVLGIRPGSGTYYFSDSTDWSHGTGSYLTSRLARKWTAVGETVSFPIGMLKF